MGGSQAHHTALPAEGYTLVQASTRWNHHRAAPLPTLQLLSTDFTAGCTGKWCQNQYEDWGSLGLSGGSTAHPPALDTDGSPQGACRPSHETSCCQNMVVFCRMEKKRVDIERPAAVRQANCLSALIALSSPTWSLHLALFNHCSGSHI